MARHKVLGGVLACCAAVTMAQLPHTVQVDLLFPVNGGTYQPTFPFPIVFALHNMASVWPYDVDFEWSLGQVEKGYPDLAAVYLESMFNGGSFDRSLRDRDSWAIPPSPWLLINGTLALSPRLLPNLTYHVPMPIKMELEYTFILRNNCTATTKPGELRPAGNNETESELAENRFKAVFERRRIEFTISEDGALPDVTSSAPTAEECGTTGGRNPSIAVTVEGEISYEDWSEGGTIPDDWNDLGGLRENFRQKACPVVAEAMPSPTPCVYPVDDALATRVEARMLEEARCTAGTWPDPTGLVERCSDESAAPTLSRSPSWALGLAVAIYAASWGMGV